MDLNNSVSADNIPFLVKFLAPPCPFFLEKLVSPIGLSVNPKNVYDTPLKINGESKYLKLILDSKISK